jgi:type IV pilus assembly protein PilW
MSSRRRERGFTLTELLVGMTVGLFVILAAIGSAGLSRGVSGSVSDLGQLQQQGSYALHVIGAQVRQAGSSEPILDPASGRHAFDAAPAPVSGSDGAGPSADSVSVAFAPSSLDLWQRDCVGAQVAKTGAPVRATFSVDGGQLTCTGVGKPQGVIRDVADFQVGYRVQTGDGMQVMDATAVEQAGLWGQVSAIEVCLDLAGAEKGPDGAAPYKDCQGETRPRNGFTHLVYRNVFAIRAR